jgi:hypothetical protein
MQRFNLNKLKKVEGEQHYHIKIWNRFTALENLDTDVDIYKTRETIREYKIFSQRESRFLRIEIG